MKLSKISKVGYFNFIKSFFNIGLRSFRFEPKDRNTVLKGLWMSVKPIPKNIGKVVASKDYKYKGH